MIESVASWILVMIVFFIDLLIVWCMVKFKRKMRMFTFVPIFQIFIIPFLAQSRILDNILLDMIKVLLIFFGFLIMVLDGYEFYKKGIILALAKKELIKSDLLRLFMNW